MEKPTTRAPSPRGTGLDMAGLGERIRMERLRRRLSLQDLLATGLGASIARLLGEERTPRVIVRRRDEQDTAADPSGWERRILSPVLPGLEFELMRTTIPQI